MKNLLACFVLLVSLNIQSQPIQVLWLGNSYTYYNDLPGMFYNLALSAGDTVVYDSNTPGGTTLQYHATNATSIQKIYAQKWDYVIVQAQSQEPSFPPQQVAQQTLPYARLLDSLITDNDSCTETVFYMTWGRKYGDQSNCANYAPLCTFDGMQARLRDSYVQMANDNQALTAPVGMAWQQSWHTDSLINLWDTDNSHPNTAGSYLAACVFYATIFRKSPVGIVYSPLSSQVTNAHLQNIAYHIVFDSLENWNIGAFLPQAEFDFSGNETTKTFDFNNLSQNFDSYEWNFGDGNSSTTSGVHTYANAGTYTVTLTVFDPCGNWDSTSQTFTMQTSSGLNDTPPLQFTVSPNPATNLLYLTAEKNYKWEVEILNALGQTVVHHHISDRITAIDISSLSSGVYWIKGMNSVKKIMVINR